MIEDTVLQQSHDDWKQKGFPYYPKDKKWRDNIFNQLINFKRDTLVDRRNKIIGQSAHGLNLAWSFMEHAWGIKCGKMRTPTEIWDDEEHLKKGLNKILSGTFFMKKPVSNIALKFLYLRSTMDILLSDKLAYFTTGSSSIKNLKRLKL